MSITAAADDTEGVLLARVLTDLRNAAVRRRKAANRRAKGLTATMTEDAFASYARANGYRPS